MCGVAQAGLWVAGSPPSVGGTVAGGRWPHRFSASSPAHPTAPPPHPPSPCSLDDKQQAHGSLKVSTDHGNATYSVSITDAAARGGDVTDGLRLGIKCAGLEAIYEPSNGHHLLRTNHTVSVSRSGRVCGGDGGAGGRCPGRRSLAALLCSPDPDACLLCCCCCRCTTRTSTSRSPTLPVPSAVSAIDCRHFLACFGGWGCALSVLTPRRCTTRLTLPLLPLSPLPAPPPPAAAATYINCSVAVDDNNTAKVIYRANPGNRLDHRNAIVGWTYRKDDLELEPRYNLGTESLSAGVTYRVDDDNKLRAVYDMGSNEASLTWTNSGALGGGGDTKVTARTKLDKGNANQMPTLLISKDWDLDV